ncbi:hypothetical protein [Bacillus cereus]|uniref:hypothetical protein n=1 Tax=Bacillus cereus TaxID=1396 RepID=UPI000BF7AFBA|nr:hypothetical protein [Bacillus cereus]PFF14671.1 hypothetical protein CN343_06945 [Bacillus cereus]
MGASGSGDDLVVGENNVAHNRTQLELSVKTDEDNYGYSLDNLVFDVTASRKVKRRVTGIRVSKVTYGISSTGFKMGVIAKGDVGTVGIGLGAEQPIGVAGRADGVDPIGVDGTASGKGSIGVWGDANSGNAQYDSGRPTGVIGTSSGEDSIGVLGNASGNKGTVGVLGVGGTSGIQGNGGKYGVVGVGETIGILGDGKTTGIRVKGGKTGAVADGGKTGVKATGETTGVLGISTSNRGFGFNFFYSGVEGIGSIGVKGTSTVESGIGVSGQGGSDGIGILGKGGAFGVYCIGDFAATGTKSALVPHSDGSHRTLYCMESPESWFEDFGIGELVKGIATVQIDPVFSEIIHNENYLVFITPEGDSKGLYVNRKTPTGFEVREQQEGTSTIPFSYRIVAKRKDVKSPRLKKVTIDEQKLHSDGINVEELHADLASDENIYSHISDIPKLPQKQKMDIPDLD